MIQTTEQSAVACRFTFCPWPTLNDEALCLLFLSVTIDRSHLKTIHSEKIQSYAPVTFFWWLGKRMAIENVRKHGLTHRRRGGSGSRRRIRSRRRVVQECGCITHYYCDSTAPSTHFVPSSDMVTIQNRIHLAASHLFLHPRVSRAKWRHLPSPCRYYLHRVLTAI